MKIPKYIDYLLDRRAKLAESLNSVDYELTKWIDKKGIEVESCDYATGCEMYVNPDASADRVREAIKNK